MKFSGFLVPLSYRKWKILGVKINRNSFLEVSGFLGGLTEERGCLLILRQPPDIKTKFNPSLILIFHQ